MKGNGVSPVLAIIVSLVFILCTVLLFRAGHAIWGVIFLIISIDCLLDVPLALKS